MFKNFSPSALGVSGHQSEMIELALTYGFAGMDLNVVEFATQAKLKGLPFAKRLIESAKIRIGTFALPLEIEAADEDFQKDLKKLAEYADCASQLGCTRCTVTLAAASDSRPYHENFEFHRRRLHDICTALQPTGIRLAVGFQAAAHLRRDRAFEFIHDLDALTLLLNMVAAPNVGLLVDTWDIVAAGGSADSIRKFPVGQLLAVQGADLPADASAELDDKSRLLPGAENGRGDVARFVAVLRELGYDGPITAKPSRSVFQSRRREVIVKQAVESLNRVLSPAATQPESGS